MAREPETPEQWQHAVDIAKGLLGIDSARAYGLVVGGPTVVISRCQEILHRGKELGFTPSPDAIETVARAYAGDDGS